MMSVGQSTGRLIDFERSHLVPTTHFSHDHVLTLLHVLALGLDDSVKEVEVLDVAAMCGQAVDKVLQDALRDLIA